ncbi:MAG: hypothetical protein DME18_11505 [Verrucomicrobia bacterium]|nr:MAG: hypothetical protein DME18_11505 [Verrucomicrobiota bacterium]
MSLLTSAATRFREQPPPGACFARTGLTDSFAGMARTRRRILPLPWGKGSLAVRIPEDRAQWSDRAIQNAKGGGLGLTRAATDGTFFRRRQ